MNDLVSRQAAIDSLDGVMFPEDSFRTWAKVAIRAVPPAQQWIPCIERLPEKEKKTYWICTDTGFQCECRWTNNVYGLGESDRWEWSIFDTPQYTKVIAWMPLPEPYKEETHETD